LFTPLKLARHALQLAKRPPFALPESH
jgi:hypothetical protein